MNHSHTQYNADQPPNFATVPTIYFSLPLLPFQLQQPFDPLLLIRLMDKSQPKSFIKAKDGVRDRVSERARTSQKVPVKENTKSHDFKLHTQERAVKRAMFNYSVATKLYVTELQKKVEDKLHKIIEEEEIRLLRKEMVPRAQLMPYFDRPYFPQRSNRPLTIPREPSFLMNKEQWSWNTDRELYSFQRQALKPIK